MLRLTTSVEYKRKHGGTFRRLLANFQLFAEEDGEATVDGNRLIVAYRSSIKTYFITNQFIVLKREFRKGDVIGYLPNLASPSYRLDGIIKLIDAYGSSTSRQQKNNISTSVSVAPIEGVITYKVTDKSIIVFIDNREITKVGLNSQTLFYYPDGSFVKKYSKISSDILNLKLYPKLEKDELHNIQSFYYAFRVQFLELMDDLSEDNMELLFRVVMDSDNYLGVRKSIEKLPIFSRLAFGYASKALSSIDDTDVIGEDEDLLTNIIFLGAINEIE